MHLKTFRYFLSACLLLAITLTTRAQTVVVIADGTKLLPDTATNGLLMKSLQGFLMLKDKPTRENPYVLKEHLPETAALLDEMKNAGQSAGLKENNFYQPQLINVTALADGTLMLQLAYMGSIHNTPLLHAVYRLMAKQQDGKFYFYSPLKRETTGWKIRNVGNITCHYKDSVKLEDIQAYQKTLNYYDTRLKVPAHPVEFYYCKDFPEVLQILGVDYKAEYNGIKSNVLSARENNTDLVLNGWYDTPHRFDPHDLFHERLRLVMDKDIINRPVDEGCAYLYGGSWGYTWREIKAHFKKYLDANPNPDWLALYSPITNFEAGQKPLKVAYVLNALIAQKLEKEKGMPAVMELLGCGKWEPDDANYFRALQKLTGISKAEFNVRMGELVRAEFK